jgi:hypothetical protein
MKKVLMLMIALVFLGTFLSAFSCEKPIPPSKEELEKAAGTWKVINVNCPNILAEKEGEKKIFRAATLITGECIDKIEPGWIVFVGKDGKYAYFPAKPAPATDK